ncbi:hypothetical protein LCGC14_2789820 [marine sediment metagenome]|uniref:Uncharacterized protein n=1 Tax=marine sediment metagenome TaxID=412755 RepID=A0A0F9AZH5_9ZZZZ
MKRLDKTLEECVRELLVFCDIGVDSEHLGRSIAVIDSDPGITYPNEEETDKLKILIERCRRKLNHIPYDVEKL